MPLDDLQTPRALLESLALDPPDNRRSGVAPVRTSDDRHLVLEVGLRHDESEHEVEGLALWAGDGTVLAHRAERDDDTSYLLLERCAQSHTRTRVPGREQDKVLAGLLRRLWVEPPAGHPVPAARPDVCRVGRPVRGLPR